jgi:hypothetical protein
MSRVFVFAVVILLGACSSGTVKQDLRKYPTLSCVSGDLANVFKYVHGNSAQVAIRMMDGNKVGSRNSVCVAPGIHYITTGAAKNWIMGEGFMRVSMETGRTYKLRAELEGPTFLIKLMEVSASGDVREVQQQQVAAIGGRR